MRHPNEPLARSSNLTRQAGLLTEARTADIQAIGSRGQRRKLLFVDDHILLRQRVIKALEPHGIAVINTSDRRTAVQLAEEIRPEFALIELCLNDNNSLKDYQHQSVVLQFGHCARGGSCIEMGVEEGETSMDVGKDST